MKNIIASMLVFYVFLAGGCNKEDKNNEELLILASDLFLLPTIGDYEKKEFSYSYDKESKYLNINSGTKNYRIKEVEKCKFELYDGHVNIVSNYERPYYINANLSYFGSINESRNGYNYPMFIIPGENSAFSGRADAEDGKLTIIFDGFAVPTDVIQARADKWKVNLKTFTEKYCAGL